MVNLPGFHSTMNHGPYNGKTPAQIALLDYSYLKHKIEHGGNLKADFYKVMLQVAHAVNSFISRLPCVMDGSHGPAKLIEMLYREEPVTKVEYRDGMPTIRSHTIMVPSLEADISNIFCSPECYENSHPERYRDKKHILRPLKMQSALLPGRFGQYGDHQTGRMRDNMRDIALVIAKAMKPDFSRPVTKKKAEELIFPYYANPEMCNEEFGPWMKRVLEHIPSISAEDRKERKRRVEVYLAKKRLRHPRKDGEQSESQMGLFDEE